MARGQSSERQASGSAHNSAPELAGPAYVKLLVGRDNQAFVMSRKVLASCQYFRKRLDAARVEVEKGHRFLVISLEDHSPDVFELFAYWMNERRNFDKFIDVAEADNSWKELHWDLVSLHLFAAQVGLPGMQDCALDAIQDVYLRCNWDINPKLINYIYTSCDPQESCRIRKWIVAMTAWTLGGVVSKDLSRKIQRLLEKCPDFWAEYHSHTRKMAQTGLEGHFKNPQLRLPSNNLRNEERQFGFRQCSFHTHRSTVGQGKCPHSAALSPFSSSPHLDGYMESDSERGDSRLGSRVVSPSSVAT